MHKKPSYPLYKSPFLIFIARHPNRNYETREAKLITIGEFGFNGIICMPVWEGCGSQSFDQTLSFYFISQFPLLVLGRKIIENQSNIYIYIFSPAQ